MSAGLYTISVALAPVPGRDFALSTLDGREHSWSLTDFDGRLVAEGTVSMRLADWDAEADRALPSGWERITGWDVSGRVAVAYVRRASQSRIDTALPLVRAALRQDTTDALVKLFNAMQPDVSARYDSGAKVLVAKRWVSQLKSVVEDRHMAAASAIGGHVADQLDYSDFDAEVMRAYLAKNAGFVADDIAGSAEDDIRAAADASDDEDFDPVDHVFGILGDSGAAAMATQMVTVASNFAARDTAAKGGAAVKVWQVTSGNPRASHAAVNGESVGLDETFSNGLLWPGDPEGDADENAGCQCALTIIR